MFEFASTRFPAAFPIKLCIHTTAVCHVIETQACVSPQEVSGATMEEPASQNLRIAKAFPRLTPIARWAIKATGNT